MGSLAASATAYRAEHPPREEGHKGRRWEEGKGLGWGAGGTGGCCLNSMRPLMLCLSLTGHRFILEGK